MDAALDLFAVTLFSSFVHLILKHAKNCSVESAECKLLLLKMKHPFVLHSRRYKNKAPSNRTCNHINVFLNARQRGLILFQSKEVLIAHILRFTSLFQDGRG